MDLSAIRERVSARIKEGFADKDAIIADVTETLADDEGTDEAELEPVVSGVAAEMFAEERARQAGWTTPTDCDRLEEAFETLDRRGIVARQNFTCCQQCGHSEIGDEIAAARDRGPVAGYAFFHAQDTERAAESGELYIAFGGTEEGPDLAMVAAEIVTELRRRELEVQWEGDVDQRILVTGLDWRRRRAFS